MKKVPKNMERRKDAKKFPDSQQVETILENFNVLTGSPINAQVYNNTNNSPSEQKHP